MSLKQEAQESFAESCAFLQNIFVAKKMLTENQA